MVKFDVLTWLGYVSSYLNTSLGAAVRVFCGSD